MAKDNEFKFHSSTVGTQQGINAGFDLQTGDWEAQQDISQYLKDAKIERDKQEYYGVRKNGYRKLATIPDIVAIKIMQDHKLDIHDPNFMKEPKNMVKLRKILMSEYRDLLINT